jgi:CRISPR-associated endoribonuclease Cas6
MLLSLVVQVRPEGGASQRHTLPATTGPALHGMLYKWLAQVDPALGTAIHDLHGVKPFTVSSLQALVGNPEASRSTYDLLLSPHQAYWFRITSLDAALSQVLLEKFYQPGQTLDLLGRRLQIERLLTEPYQHPWAARTTYHDLPENPPSLPPRLKLQFHSPTTFKAVDRVVPVPMPEQVFNSLATRWNSFSELPLDPAQLSALTEKLAISGYQLSSELALLEGSPRGPKLIACRGWCEYTIINGEEEETRLLHLLSRFGFYSGVGYKTSQGFGQIRPL